jgi:hypothetical protein
MAFASMVVYLSGAELHKVVRRRISSMVAVKDIG